jgi:fucose permease
MFTMFALTTDSVGVIIPVIIRDYQLSMKAASAFNYVTMTAIAVAAILFGFMADRLGRKATILIGLSLFALNSYLFAVGNSFGVFLVLLAISGASIGIFKTGALALIGDISTSTVDHTSTMNAVEGFFGVGAIIGPAIVRNLLQRGVSWKYLYVIAGTLCVLLIVIAMVSKYPKRTGHETPMNLGHTLQMVCNPYALSFSMGIFLYVGVENAIIVWMPTLLQGYKGPEILMMLALYGISVFFMLRAGGRFLGSLLLKRFSWSSVLALFAGAIFLCFAGAMLFTSTAVILLPLSGLFMSVIYPTINSKGISCFKKSEHGAVAGVILFFTCGGAALAPFLMGVVGDYFHSPKAGFVLATGFAALLFLGTLWNVISEPAKARLQASDDSEYAGAH